MTTATLRRSRVRTFLDAHRRELLVALALLLVVAVVLLSLATRLTPYVRDQAVAALDQRFQGDVALEALQVSIFPRPEVWGAGLALRHNGRTDVPPLLEIGSFSASAGLFGLLSSPVRLRTVELDRLEIRIPPGGVPRSGTTGAAGVKGGLIIDEIVSREARLEIVPRQAGKLPRVFEIHDLVMGGVGDGTGAPFHARLTNPTPRGDVTTQGQFGPWQKEDPRRTPLRGRYVFDQANLDTIKGLAGTLSSTGTYAGVLERIEVEGETRTPDFAIDVAAQPVPLATRFRAVVDGTNGDTFLDHVEARLIETTILAKGSVVRAEDVKGRRTALTVRIEDGRLEDVLRLAVKSKRPLMTGLMDLETSFLLPAGDAAVVDRLQLAGTFGLARARFTDIDVQRRINELSRRGRGKPTGPDANVVSNFSGAFVLRDGQLRFRRLQFAVPGAVVQLAGTLNLRRETLDFKGDLLLDATLADMTTGFKSVLARIAQPLFRRKGGGSKLPIRIAGPISKPEFGLDVKRALTPGD